MRVAWWLAHSILWLRVRITPPRHLEPTTPLHRGSSSMRKTIHHSSPSILWYRPPTLPQWLHQPIPFILPLNAPTPTCNSILLVLCSIRLDWSCGRSGRWLMMFWIRGFWTFYRNACLPSLLWAWHWGSGIWDRIGPYWICYQLWGCSLGGWGGVVIEVVGLMIPSLSSLSSAGALRILARTLHCWMIYIIILNLAYYLELFHQNHQVIRAQ